jgi:hypothetical protein
VVADEVEVTPERVTFPPLGGRRLRLTAAAVLVLGGLTQTLAGLLAPATVLVVAGLVAVAFGASVGLSARRGTTVTSAGWLDPTRVRNQRIAWSELRSVRLTTTGSRATVVLDRRDAGAGPGLRVARVPAGRVTEVVAAIRAWAEAAGVEVVDRTLR